jgi:hypothetical protein
MKIKLSQILPILFGFLVLIILFFSFVYYQFYVKKELQLISPNGGETLRAGEEFVIRWKAKKIDKITIVLVREGERPKKSKIIVEDFPAKEKSYKWKIFPFEEPSDRYKISIFESPWSEGKKIDYSDNYFSIIGPKFVSCDEFSIKENWPFLPNDYPNLKRVFITSKGYSGNLDGLEGADKICQQEAKMKGLDGNWKALLGDDNISATERLNLDGVFVFAEVYKGLPPEKIPPYFWKSFQDYLKNFTRGNEKLEKILNQSYETLSPYFYSFYQRWNTLQENKGCVRFIAENFQKFYQKLFSTTSVDEDYSSNKFFKDFFQQEIWLGRIFPEDRKNCIDFLPSEGKESSNLSMSWTATCQNWTNNQGEIKIENTKETPPQCYTKLGAKVDALGIGGLARISRIKENKLLFETTGRRCDYLLKLLCIEQPILDKKD